jgi:amino acid adenylation domain-containing protein
MKYAAVIDKTDGRSLRSGFLQSVSRYPDRPALMVAGVQRSYAELAHNARVWAQAMVTCLNRPAERVGIFAYRSEVAYTGVLAALLSGAAFVPLNQTFPVERTRAMIQRAQLDALVVDRTSVPQLPDVLRGIKSPPVILLPEETTAQWAIEGTQLLRQTELQQHAPLQDLPPIIPQDIAYLLFTSGSTGEPKGVPVSHGNVLHFLDVVTKRYGITPEDRFSQTFDLTFDLSLFDLFVAWSNGACVYSMQPLDLLAPSRFVSKHQITVWFSVPSVPALLRKKNLLQPGIFPSLRWSLFCGEPLPRQTAEVWQTAAPNSILENLYGPTELTIACFTHRWDSQKSPALCVNNLVPIGRPFEGLGAVVVNDQLEPLKEYEIGELCVCGPQTTPGYWKDEKKTAERFVHLSLHTPSSLRFYRTGDLVKRLENGEYIFFGRSDYQIKVLGHRVELGEVEAVLSRQPGVIQAVAMGWPIKEGTAEGIVAFVSGSEVDTEQLLSGCRALLPSYMVPRKVFVMDEMPLNVNGKIDRKVLQDSLPEIMAQAKV